MNVKQAREGTYAQDLITQYPYGSTRSSSGSLDTDKEFTGQRLDDTGLYYYGARYYDPTIGRFISPDTTIPDSMNPQSYNRYSYCINNPLSAIDPSGSDYIFVCGSGGKRSDWDTIISALNIDTSEENIYYVDDTETGFGWEVQDQTQGIIDHLATGELTDIKIIGHSEGGAATVNVLDKLANDSDFLAGTNVRTELEAAIMLETPTGFLPSLPVAGWSDNAYNNLPRELAGSGMAGVKLLDVWNTASVVHSTGRMPGWGKSNTYAYDSRSWWEKIISRTPFNLVYRLSNTMRYHNDPQTNSKVIEEIKKTVGV